MTFFSIVVPVLNEASIIRQQLRPLQALRKAGHELIVVDGGSDDNSAAIAEELADHVLVSERGRARQMNAGAAVANQDYLMFLHLDTRLPASVSNDLHAFATSDKRWGFFKVRLDDAACAFRVIEFFMNRRSTFTAIATGDQALVFERNIFEGLNGFADIPLMEDIEICKRLKDRGQPWIARGKVSCNTRKWRKHGIVRTTMLMWRLRLAYFFGVSTRKLHERYYGR
jgi:rSAM/selenodomain-associated transferase 2